MSSKQAMTKKSASSALATSTSRPRHGKGLVEIAFDAPRTKVGIDRANFDARRGTAAFTATPIFFVIEAVVLGLMT